MKKHLKPLSFGDLTLPNNIIGAPLSGVSDYPFRQMVSQYHNGLNFCEMVKMQPLVRQHPGTLRLLDYHEEMRPIGGQIVGSASELAGESAKILEDLGFDLVDFNCGCPVDKVTKDGSGSGMLKNPEHIGEILSNMIHAVKIPVTLKIRVGWDLDHINAAQITKIAEQAGAKAITVHGRTRQQAYRGKANWALIKECVDAAKTIKVIGNGDIFTPESALEMFETTGCDGVLIARGSMGQPWIFQQVTDFLEGKEVLPKTDRGRIETLCRHIDMIKGYYTGRTAIVTVRKVGCWYLKELPMVRNFRSKISRVETLEEIDLLLDQLIHSI